HRRPGLSLLRPGTDAVFRLTRRGQDDRPRACRHGTPDTRRGWLLLACLELGHVRASVRAGGAVHDRLRPHDLRGRETDALVSGSRAYVTRPPRPGAAISSAMQAARHVPSPRLTSHLPERES